MSTTSMCVVVGTLEKPTKEVTNGTLRCSVPDGADRIYWKREDEKPLPPHAEIRGPYGEVLV